MAKQFSKIRTSLYGIVIVVLWGAAAIGFSQDFGTPYGDTAGMVSPDPDWSLGVQVGSLGQTGVSAQNTSFAPGAVNFHVGSFLGALTISADYLWLMTPEFSMDPHHNTYRTTRGKITPYLGAGGQIGAIDAVRGSLGMQYTPLKDPINFFGSIMILAAHDDFFGGIDTAVAITLGVRLLM